MVESIRANLVKLTKEINATIEEIDAELSETRPALKLLVPTDDETKRFNLLGHKDVLSFISTLLDKIFYIKPEPSEDEPNLAYFREQLDKSIALIEDSVKRAKSQHPAMGIPELTDKQLSQLVGRQEMFQHFKVMLSEFEL